MSDEYVKLDWLNFRWSPDPDEAKEIIAYEQGKRGIGATAMLEMFMDKFPEFFAAFEKGKMLVYGKHNWSNVLVFAEEMRVQWDDATRDEDGKLMSCSSMMNKGVCVSIPSKALHNIYEWFNLPDRFDNCYDLFRILADRGAVPTRIDIAWDDMNRVYTPDFYAQKMHLKMVKTRARTWSYVSSEKNSGATCYFGSGRSRIMLRIYDKGFESKGSADYINSIRYEFEIKAERAKDVFDYILKHKGLNFLEYLFGYVTILKKVCNDRHNIDKVPVDQEWQDSLKVKFNEPFKTPVYIKHDSKPTSFFASICHHANNATSTKACVEALGGWESFRTFIEDQCKGRMKEKHLAIIKEGKAERLKQDGLFSRISELSEVQRQNIMFVKYSHWEDPEWMRFTAPNDYNPGNLQFKVSPTA